MNITPTALSGVRVGHATRTEKLTGVTVVTFDRDLPVAVSCHGGDPGTFNADSLTAGKNGGYARAIFISGGSYTGLQSGAAVMAELIAQGIGPKLHSILNPNVTGAIILDLGTRIEQFDPSLGAEALRNVSSAPSERGNVGAGTGAAVGKFYYPQQGAIFAGMKGGIGCARVDLGNGGIVVALTTVNALGNIVLKDGSILAGNRSDRSNVTYESFLDIQEHFAEQANTTITIVGTNVALPHQSGYERVAHLASHGHVRAINPVNLSLDGDTVFVFSTEEVASLHPTHPDAGAHLRGSSWEQFDVDLLGQAAAEAVQESIYDACRCAESVQFPTALNGVVPSCNDYPAF